MEENHPKSPTITTEFSEDSKAKQLQCKPDVKGNQFVFTILPTEEGPPGFPKEITPAGKEIEVHYRLGQHLEPPSPFIDS